MATVTVRLMVRLRVRVRARVRVRVRARVRNRLIQGSDQGIIRVWARGPCTLQAG